MAKAAKKGVKNDSTPKEDQMSAEDPKNIDKIRDILFGSKERQYDQKFSTIETTIQKEIGDLRNETQKALAALENNFNKELASLVEQLRAEQTERLESGASLVAKIDDARQVLDRKLSHLGDTAVAGQRDLQEQLLQHSKDLREEIHEKNEALSYDLESAARELRREKTDRDELANVLMEVALRLKDESERPPRD